MCVLCAVESVLCGVPGVFVSRQFQRRVQSPMTGANPSNPLDFQHKPETTSTSEIGLVHLCFRPYPGVQARSIGTVVVHAYSPSGICAQRASQYCTSAMRERERDVSKVQQSTTCGD